MINQKTAPIFINNEYEKDLYKRFLVQNNSHSIKNENEYSVKKPKNYKKQISGTAGVIGGTYAIYNGINHGLPRALGIRTEYHITGKDNAELIKKAGNVLNPAFGGINGLSDKIKDSNYISNSKNYIHITGINKNTDMNLLSFSNFSFSNLSKAAQRILFAPARTLYRKFQCITYRAVSNAEDATKGTFLELMKNAFKFFSKNKTKKFCIPGIDSYFNNNFINDEYDLALKSSKELKVYNNRFSAMFSGLKKFKLNGIKENKSRAIFGALYLCSGIYIGYKLIKNGIKKITSSSANKT